MRIAIFSDIHGKILLPFKSVELYQKETGNKVDYILQCGDIGAYLNIENLDKATIRHARYDRDELGFYDDFTKINPAIKTFLDELNINMICVGGNHEDHHFLDSIEKENPQNNLFSIDVYQRVFICKSGLKQVLQTTDEALTLIGIGRIGDHKELKSDLFTHTKNRKSRTCLKQEKRLTF